MAWQISIIAHSKPEALARLAEYQTPQAEETYPPMYTEHAKANVQALPDDPTQGVSVSVTGAPASTDPAGADVHFVIGRIPFGHPDWRGR